MRSLLCPLPGLLQRLTRKPTATASSCGTSHRYPHKQFKIGSGMQALLVNFCEFSKVVCTIKIAETLQTFRPQITDTAGGRLDPIVWRLIFQDAMRRLDQDGWPGVPSTILMSCAINLLVDGRPPLSIEVRASVRRIVRDVSVASLVAYADPVCSTRHAQIGHFDLGKSEVIENRDDVGVIIDLSQINTPAELPF